MHGWVGSQMLSRCACSMQSLSDMLCRACIAVVCCLWTSQPVKSCWRLFDMAHAWWTVQVQGSLCWAWNWCTRSARKAPEDFCASQQQSLDIISVPSLCNINRDIYIYIIFINIYIYIIYKQGYIYIYINHNITANMLDTGKTKFEQCQKCVVAVAIPHFCFRYSAKPKAFLTLLTIVGLLTAQVIE